MISKRRNFFHNLDDRLIAHVAPRDLEVEVGKAREQVRVEGPDALKATKFVALILVIGGRRSKSPMSGQDPDPSSSSRVAPTSKVVINKGQRRRPTVGILFRNVIERAKVTKHAIARATGEQYARRSAGRFRTTRWSVELLSAEVVG